MRREYRHLLNYLADFGVLLVEGTLFAYLWFIYYVPILEESHQGFWNRGNWAVIGMYLLLVFFFTKTLGGYRIGYLRISDICLSQVLALVCANFIGYFQIAIVVRDYVNAVPILILLIVECIFVIPWVILMRWLYVRMYPATRMLLVYGKYSPHYLVKKMYSRRDRYNVKDMVNISEGYEAVYAKIRKHDAVILSDLPSKVRNQILKFCFDEKKRTYITPKISDIIITGAEKIHLFDTPLYLARNEGLTIEQRFFKRFMDLVFSVAAIIISSPLMLLFALGIKLYDKGPVFYTQDRLTRDEKSFQIIKFRSMAVGSEKKGARLAKQGDERITPIGKILRATHLDELPQIFNILKGEMSFVGPRPERAEIAQEYESLVPEFRFRLTVKAGLTGYAQVHGKYNTTPYDKLKLDLTYIEDYSFWLDLRLMFMTFKIMFQKENTEGVSQNQKTALINDAKDDRE